MSKQPPPASTVSAVRPCPTVIKIVGRPGTGSVPSTIATPDQPPIPRTDQIEDTLQKSDKTSRPKPGKAVPKPVVQISES